MGAANFSGYTPNQISVLYQIYLTEPENQILNSRAEIVNLGKKLSGVYSFFQKFSWTKNWAERNLISKTVELLTSISHEGAAQKTVTVAGAILGKKEKEPLADQQFRLNAEQVKTLTALHHRYEFRDALHNPEHWLNKNPTLFSDKEALRRAKSLRDKEVATTDQLNSFAFFIDNWTALNAFNELMDREEGTFSGYYDPIVKAVPQDQVISVINETVQFFKSGAGSLEKSTQCALAVWSMPTAKSQDELRRRIQERIDKFPYADLNPEVIKNQYIRDQLGEWGSGLAAFTTPENRQLFTQALGQPYGMTEHHSKSPVYQQLAGIKSDLESLHQRVITPRLAGRNLEKQFQDELQKAFLPEGNPPATLVDSLKGFIQQFNRDLAAYELNAESRWLTNQLGAELRAKALHYFGNEVDKSPLQVEGYRNFSEDVAAIEALKPDLARFNLGAKEALIQQLASHEFQSKDELIAAMKALRLKLETIVSICRSSEKQGMVFTGEVLQTIRKYFTLPAKLPGPLEMEGAGTILGPLGQESERRIHEWLTALNELLGLQSKFEDEGFPGVHASLAQKTLKASDHRHSTESLQGQKAALDAELEHLKQLRIRFTQDGLKEEHVQAATALGLKKSTLTEFRESINESMQKGVWPIEQERLREQFGPIIAMKMVEIATRTKNKLPEEIDTHTTAKQALLGLRKKYEDFGLAHEFTLALDAYAKTSEFAAVSPEQLTETVNRIATQSPLAKAKNLTEVLTALRPQIKSAWDSSGYDHSGMLSEADLDRIFQQVDSYEACIYAIRMAQWSKTLKVKQDTDLFKEFTKALGNPYMVAVDPGATYGRASEEASIIKNAFVAYQKSCTKPAPFSRDVVLVAVPNGLKRALEAYRKEHIGSTPAQALTGLKKNEKTRATLFAYAEALLNKGELAGYKLEDQSRVMDYVQRLLNTMKIGDDLPTARTLAYYKQLVIHGAEVLRSSPHTPAIFLIEFLKKRESFGSITLNLVELNQLKDHELSERILGLKPVFDAIPLRQAQTLSTVIKSIKENLPKTAETVIKEVVHSQLHGKQTGRMKELDEPINSLKTAMITSGYTSFESWLQKKQERITPEEAQARGLTLEEAEAVRMTPEEAQELRDNLDFIEDIGSLPLREDNLITIKGALSKRFKRMINLDRNILRPQSEPEVNEAILKARLRKMTLGGTITSLLDQFSRPPEEQDESFKNLISILDQLYPREDAGVLTQMKAKAVRGIVGAAVKQPGVLRLIVKRVGEKSDVATQAGIVILKALEMINPTSAENRESSKETFDKYQAIARLFLEGARTPPNSVNAKLDFASRFLNAVEEAGSAAIEGLGPVIMSLGEITAASPSQ